MLPVAFYCPLLVTCLIVWLNSIIVPHSHKLPWMVHKTYIYLKNLKLAFTLKLKASLTVECQCTVYVWLLCCVCVQSAYGY